MKITQKELKARISEVKRRSGVGGMRPFEYPCVAKTILRKAPCNVLVFGVGHDSELWLSCNVGGYTVFLEDSKKWARMLKDRHPEAIVELVQYASQKETDSSLADEKLTDLSLEISPNISGRNWNVIVVDAPKGHKKEHPGRRQSIFTASILRNKDTTVFVHDVNSSSEWRYCNRWLGKPPRVTSKLAVYDHYGQYRRFRFFLFLNIKEIGNAPWFKETYVCDCGKRMM